MIIWYNKNKKAEERAQELGDEFGVKCRAYSVDVTNPEEVEQAITSQMKEFNNRLDVFVYNSGVAWTGECAKFSVSISIDSYFSPNAAHPSI